MSHFHIKNLNCGYNDNTVLEIPDLKIEKGKLYFIVGSSGIGKSTFLEMIGLMNNTAISSNSEINFWDKKKEVNICSLWSDKTKLSQFRLENYAFIFQSTNLIPHYTVSENIVVPMLLQGLSFDESKRRILPIMERLNLPPDEFLDRKVERLSGGQQQRVAFIRAFMSDYNVLFGDEPTGNLDVKTAKDLMESLKEQIIKHDKTAIIVSHDVELALDHADYIVAFSKRDVLSDTVSTGTLLPENIFNVEQHKRTELRDRILSLYNVDVN